MNHKSLMSWGHLIYIFLVCACVIFWWRCCHVNSDSFIVLWQIYQRPHYHCTTTHYKTITMNNQRVHECHPRLNSFWTCWTTWQNKFDSPQPGTTIKLIFKHVDAKHKIVACLRPKAGIATWQTILANNPFPEPFQLKMFCSFTILLLKIKFQVR